MFKNYIEQIIREYLSRREEPYRWFTAKLNTKLIKQGHEIKELKEEVEDLKNELDLALARLGLLEKDWQLVKSWI